MASQGASLAPCDKCGDRPANMAAHEAWHRWRDAVRLAMDYQHTSTRQVVAAAKRRGLKISVGTMAEAMTGKIPPNDRVVAAYSIILGIPPDELGFERSPLTELGYLAFEAVSRTLGDDKRRPRRAA